MLHSPAEQNSNDHLERLFWGGAALYPERALDKDALQILVLILMLSARYSSTAQHGLFSCICRVFMLNFTSWREALQEVGGSQEEGV